MLTVSKINVYGAYNQQLPLTNANLKQKQATYSNNYCLNQQPIVFKGKIGTLKEIIFSKYLAFKLKSVLNGFDLTCQRLSKNNFGFKDDVLSEECKGLIKHVSKKEGTKPVPAALETDFNKVEDLLEEQGINLSSEQKAELLNRFNLFKLRKKLTGSIIESLEFLKQSKIFKHYSVMLQTTINKMDRAIRCFGLSQEVKDIVIKAEDDLDVKLDLPDSLDLAKNIYNRLLQHKKSGHTLPQNISFNDFEFLTKHNPALSAVYVGGKKPRNYDLFIIKHPTIIDKFDKKQIFFNPVFLILRQNKKDYTTIYEDFEHELGHFWHNLNIGNEAFYSKKMDGIDGFLSTEDNNFLLDLKNKLSEKVCFIPTINFEGELEEDLSKTIPDLQNMIDYRYDLNVENVISDEIIAKFNQIMQKLEKITCITLKNFSDCPDEVEYALISPKELVAFAIQKRKNHKYDNAFLDLLQKLGMPDIKD